MSTVMTAGDAAWSTSYAEPSTMTPRDARHYAVRFLTGRGLPFDLVDKIGLVAWHLVDNAGLHGAGAIRIGVTLDREGVQVTVHDQGRTTEFGPDHNGLTIVKSLAVKFEVIPDRFGSGKSVIAFVSLGREITR